MFLIAELLPVSGVPLAVAPAFVNRLPFAALLSLTPASIFKKMLAFGKIYQIEEEQDFMEAARIYSEEAALIDQMRDKLDEDGLTVMKTYKTGDVEVAHPLLAELPRHVESANKCLMTISSMIEDRGAKKQKPTRELDKFRLHA